MLFRSADLLAVTYEVRAGALVATVGNEVLTDMSSGGGDFFDLLRVRVEARGPRQGWVRLHKGSVGVRLEDRPAHASSRPRAVLASV